MYCCTDAALKHDFSSSTLLVLLGPKLEWWQRLAVGTWKDSFTLFANYGATIGWIDSDRKIKTSKERGLTHCAMHLLSSTCKGNMYHYVHIHFLKVLGSTVSGIWYFDPMGKSHGTIGSCRSGSAALERAIEIFWVSRGCPRALEMPPWWPMSFLLVLLLNLMDLREKNNPTILQVPKNGIRDLHTNNKHTPPKKKKTWQ